MLTGIGLSEIDLMIGDFKLPKRLECHIGYVCDDFPDISTVGAHATGCVDDDRVACLVEFLDDADIVRDWIHCRVVSRDFW